MIWWVSPTLLQSQRTERQMIGWLKRSKSKDWKHRRSAHAIDWKNLSTIEFHTTAFSDNLRGEGLNLVIVDEAADVEEYAWTNVIRPMLIERQGDALFLGTPRGRNNYLHGLFMKGQSGENGFASINFPTSANPAIPTTEISDLRASMTDFQFRQEIEAEFVDGINSVFPNIRDCLDETLELPAEPLKTARHVTGVDLALHHDWTAIVTLDVYNGRLVAFHRMQRTTWRHVVETIITHCRKWPGSLMVDSTGVGDPIAESLRDSLSDVQSFTFTDISRGNLINSLALAMAHKKIRYPNIMPLVAELGNFIYREDREGHFRPAAASSGHDDCIMALALAWHALDKSCYTLSPKSFERGIFS